MDLGKATVPLYVVVGSVIAVVTWSLAYSAGSNANDIKNSTQDSDIQSVKERVSNLEAGFQSMNSSVNRVSESNVEVKTELRNVAQNVNDMRLDLKDYILGKKK